MAASASVQQQRVRAIADSKNVLESQTAPQITGGNGAWRKILAQAEIVAQHLQVATIEGEQGSGKETLARYLHVRSFFARSTFQRYDAREWLATAVDHQALTGFVYLCHVDSLDPTEWNHLLEVLKAVQDLPRGRAAIVVAARSSFRHLAREQTLLPDLALQLGGARFVVPPLRNRREDIPLLAQLMLNQLRARHQKPIALGPGALARLLQHTWPGNIRELASVLASATLAATNGVIHAEDLLFSSSNEVSTVPRTIPPPAGNLNLHAFIRKHVQYVLDLNSGNKLRSSRQLGISRSTLYRILSEETVLGR
jgi:two-component system response regulator HydG